MSKIPKIIENKKHYDGIRLTERMKECHTYAISIAIIENYEVCEVYTHGVKSRNTEEKVTTNTLFQAGSISKAIFAVGIMRLIDHGTLDLDADICEYLIDYDVPTYDKQKHKITLRQILSHHAGLNLHGFAGYQQGQKIPTIEQILKGAFPSNHIKLKLHSQPGIRFQYSGGGYMLAQKLVNDISKRDFCELMNDLVLSPFSMRYSTYSQPLPGAKHNEAAFGYNHHNLELPGGYNIMPELSAAGLWTTPSDLGRFGIEIMNALKGESKYLQKDTAELMITKASEDSPYGLGLAVSECKKGLTFGHGGSNFGYHSSMCFCPNEGSGIVVMQNSDIGRQICSEVTNSFKEICDW